MGTSARDLVPELFRDTIQTKGPVSAQDLLQQTQQPSALDPTMNRLRNLWLLHVAGFKFGFGQQLNPEEENILNEYDRLFKERGPIKDVFTQLARRLSYFGVPKQKDETAPSLREKLAAVTPEAMLAGIPDIATRTLTAPFEALLGVGLDKETLYGLNNEQRTQAVLDEAANLSMFAATAGAGALVRSAQIARGTKAITASKGVPGAIEVGQKAVRGNFRRAAERGLAEGVAGGSVQAAIAGVGQEGVGTDVLINGIIFAPVGVAFETGMQVFRRKPDVVQRTIAERALDVAKTRQLQVTTKDSFADVLYKLDALENADNIAEAVILGRLRARPDEPLVVPGISREGLPRVIKAIASGESKIVPQFYNRPDGLLDMLVANEKLPLSARRSFDQTGFVEGQLVDVDGKQYKFRSLSRDGQMVNLTDFANGRTVRKPRSSVRPSSGALEFDVTPEAAADLLWQDFRAMAIADAQAQPTPQPTTPAGVRPNAPVPATNMTPLAPPQRLVGPSVGQRIKSGLGFLFKNRQGILKLSSTGDEILYSRVERAIMGSPQQKGTGKEWQAWLKQTPGWEREWVGLEDYLKQNENTQLTRQQVYEKFASNQIDLTEITLGGKEWQEAYNKMTATEQAWRDFLGNMSDKYSSRGEYWDPRYDVLSPEEETLRSRLQQEMENAQAVYRTAPNPAQYAAAPAYNEIGGTNYREILIGINNLASVAFDDHHFPPHRVSGRPIDLLFHIRLKDRTLPNGEKVLFVEEIQSDRFEKMRTAGITPKEQIDYINEKRAYIEDLSERRNEALAKLRELTGESYEKMDYDNTEMVNELYLRDREYARLDRLLDAEHYALEDYVEHTLEGVPDAPFRDTRDWIGLAVKRILAEAALGNYDRIAWTKGIHQYFRYGSDVQQWETTTRQAFERRIPRHVEGAIPIEGISIAGESSNLDNPDAFLTGLAHYSSIFIEKNEMKSLVAQLKAAKDEGERTAVLPMNYRMSLQVMFYNSENLGTKALKLFEKILANPERGKSMPRFEGNRYIYENVTGSIMKEAMRKLGTKVDIEDVLFPEITMSRRSEFAFTNSWPDERFAVSSVRIPADLRKKIAIEKLPLGSTAPVVAGTIAAAGTGALIGAASGDTLEEQERNALLGGIAGVAAAVGAARLAKVQPKLATKPVTTPVSTLLEQTPRSNFQALLDRFGEQRGFTAQERAVLEREFTQRLFQETYNNLPPEERAVISALNEEVEQTILRPGGSRLEQAQTAAKIASEEVIRKANTNGMYVDEEASGNLTLRDFASGKIVGRFKTTTEAIEFIDKSGQLETVNLEGVGGNIPPRIGSGLPPIDGSRPHYADTPYTAASNTVLGHLNDLINTSWDWAAPNRKILQSMDSMFRTQFFARVYDKTNEAAIRSHAAVRPWYEKLSTADKVALKLSKAEREIVKGYMATKSPAELKADMSPEAIQLAEQFAAQDIDLVRVIKYLKEARRLQKDAANGKITDLNAAIQAAQAGFKLDPAHVQAAQIVGNLQTTGGFLGPIARLTNAILNKDLSRADYAKLHKMNGRQLQLAHMLEDLDRQLIRVFGNSDIYGFENLATHARLYTEGNIVTALADFNIPSTIKDFYIALSKTGQLSSYEKDPVRSLQRYIKAGFDSRILTPEIEKARQAIPEELAKLPDDARGKAELVAKRYLNDLQGIPTVAPKFTQAAVNKFLDHLSLRVPINVREDIINLILATGEAAAQGFRIVAGIRDFQQGVKWYFANFGLSRTLKMLEYGTKGLNGITKADLEAGGISPELSVLFFTTPTEFTGTTLGRTTGAFGRGLRAISQSGLKWSGQKNVYSLLHAGSYLETFKFTGDILTKLAREEIDRTTAYKKLIIDTYELPTIAEFDRLVRAEKYDDASRLLARENGRRQVGVFGAGNNPGGWNRNIGRVIGQFGTWSMWYRTELARAWTRGTLGQRYAFRLRWAAAEAATLATATALGVNLSNWYAPTGAIFVGGPVVDAFETIADAIQGNGYIQDIALARLRRYLPYDPISGEWHPGQIYIPGSYFINDLAEAYRLSEEGDDRAMLRLLGVRPEE